MVDVEMLLVGVICTFITLGVIVEGFQHYKAESKAKERRKIEEEEDRKRKEEQEEEERKRKEKEYRKRKEEEDRKRKEEQEEEERKRKEVIFKLSDELKIDREDVHGTLSDIWKQLKASEDIKTACFPLTAIQDERGFGVQLFEAAIVRPVYALATLGYSEWGRGKSVYCGADSIIGSIDSKSYDHNIYIFLSTLKDLLPNKKGTYLMDEVGWVSWATGYGNCNKNKYFIFKNKNDEKYCCNIRTFMKASENHTWEDWNSIINPDKDGPKVWGGKRRRRVRKTKRNKS